VLCDPPYGLGDAIEGGEMAAMLSAWLDGQGHDVGGGGFMGRDWDASVIDPPVWEAIKSVCKSGAVLASFGGTRTFDIQSLAQRLAGWEMRDSLHWVYGSGFPKSHDVSKAIDKAEGADREVVGDYRVSSDFDRHDGSMMNVKNSGGSNKSTKVEETAPATPDAKRFNGYGTALAPAHEPIGLWRKPTDQTFAACAVEEGCGCLNIDGCRTGTERPDGQTQSDYNWSEYDNENVGKVYGSGAGRWPANFLLVHDARCDAQCVDGCPVKVMDGQSGRSSSSRGELPMKATNGLDYGEYDTSKTKIQGYNDSGGASRFFPRFRYIAKAAKSEREAGLFEGDGRLNTHPCVKPIMLCKWLATLLLPPERETPRRLLVPFSGSGSEMIGALLAGWDHVIGIEREPDYADIARDRLEWWSTHGDDAVEAHKQKAQSLQEEAHGQMMAFDLKGE